MEINSVKSEQIFISLSDNPQRYCIQKWLPLNSENYQKYLKVEGLAERIEMLNKITKNKKSKLNTKKYIKKIEKKC